MSQRPFRRGLESTYCVCCSGFCKAAFQPAKRGALHCICVLSLCGSDIRTFQAGCPARRAFRPFAQARWACGWPSPVADGAGALAGASHVHPQGHQGGVPGSPALLGRRGSRPCRSRGEGHPLGGRRPSRVQSRCPIFLPFCSIQQYTAGLVYCCKTLFLCSPVPVPFIGTVGLLEVTQSFELVT